MGNRKTVSGRNRKRRVSGRTGGVRGKNNTPNWRLRTIGRARHINGRISASHTPYAHIYKRISLLVVRQNKSSNTREGAGAFGDNRKAIEEPAYAKSEKQNRQPEANPSEWGRIQLHNKNSE